LPPYPILIVEPDTRKQPEKAHTRSVTKLQKKKAKARLWHLPWDICDNVAAERCNHQQRKPHQELCAVITVYYPAPQKQKSQRATARHHIKVSKINHSAVTARATRLRQA
jgi:hypothetical protein